MAKIARAASSSVSVKSCDRYWDGCECFMKFSYCDTVGVMATGWLKTTAFFPERHRVPRTSSRHGFDPDDVDIEDQWTTGEGMIEVHLHPIAVDALDDAGQFRPRGIGK